LLIAILKVYFLFHEPLLALRSERPPDLFITFLHGWRDAIIGFELESLDPCWAAFMKEPKS